MKNKNRTLFLVLAYIVLNSSVISKVNLPYKEWSYANAHFFLSKSKVKAFDEVLTSPDDIIRLLTEDDETLKDPSCARKLINKALKQNLKKTRVIISISKVTALGRYCAVPLYRLAKFQYYFINFETSEDDYINSVFTDNIGDLYDHEDPLYCRLKNSRKKTIMSSCYNW